MRKLLSPKYLILLSFAQPFHAFACYFDFQSKIDDCQRNGYETVLVECSDVFISADNAPSYRIGCKFPGVDHYYDCYQSFPVSQLKLCPAPDASPAINKVATENTKKVCGSIINIDERSVSEVIPVVGTPFSLTYSSDRMMGRKDWYNVKIPISGSYNNSLELTGYKLTVTILGKTTVVSFPANLNLDYVFSWDGKDSAGVFRNGSHEASVVVDQLYNFNSCAGNELNLPRGGSKIVTSSSGCEPKYSQPVQSNIFMGSIFGSGYGFGGWDLNVHHYYDFLRQVLYLGNGDNYNTGAIQQADGTYLIVSPDRTEVFVFDSNLKHIGTKNALTGITEYSFEYQGDKLVGVQDKYGNLTSIQYGSDGSPLLLTSPFGQVTSFGVNAQGLIATVTNPASESYEISYTTDGLLTTFKKPNGVMATMSYDSNGQLHSDSNSAGSEVNLSVTNTGNGKVISHNTALGRETRFEFSSSGSSNHRVERYPDQRTVYSNVDIYSKNEGLSWSNFNLTKTFTADQRFRGIARMPYEVNFIPTAGVQQINRYAEQVTLSNPNDPFSFNQMISSWTANGKRTATTYNKAASSVLIESPMSRKTSLQLNALGDVTSLQYANFLPMNLTYDLKGRIKTLSQGTRTTTYNYNSAGFVSGITNPLSQSTGFTYDPIGRVLTQTLADGRMINFGYDLNGNLTNITPPGKKVHSFAYNDFDLVGAYNPPLLLQYNSTATNYFYNNDKQLTGVQRPDGQQIDFLYGQSSGLLQSMTFPTGMRNFTYVNGYLAGSVSEDQVSIYRDTIGSLVYSDSISAGKNFNLFYTYEGTNINKASEKLQGQSISFQYDDDGLLLSAGPKTYSRDPQHGSVLQTTLDGVTQSYTYSSDFGEVSRVSVNFSGTNVFNESYTRDALGRIVSKAEQYGAATSNSYTYTYDSAGRLTSVSLNGTLKAQYQYDSNSNRILVSANSSGSGTTTATSTPGNSSCKNTPAGKKCPGSPAIGKIPSQAQVPWLTTSSPGTVATYDDQDRLLTYGTKSFSYNANGDLVSVVDSSNGTTKTLTYDVFGNLKAISASGKTITYGVDAYNRRTWKKVDGVLESYFIWNKDNQLVAIAAPDGSIASRFVYGSKSHVPDYMIKGFETFDIVTNHLGSPVVVLNSVTGQVVQEMKYDEFGGVVSDTAPGATPFGFAGCLYEVETQLCRFGARDYDASIGRWLSKDPILFAGGDTNLYGYVMQDPINLIDPSGLKPPHYIPFRTEIFTDNMRAAQNMNAFQFANAVRTGGMWDYKQYGRQYEDLGNYNYGLTGTAAGFSSGVLQRAAGAYQWWSNTSSPQWSNPLGGYPYGDDPRDQRQIQEGINDCSSNYFAR